MKTVAIIQARVGSTRLPGKVMMDLAGATMLERVVRRTLRTQRLSTVVVATTTQNQDQVIVDLCHRKGIPVTRGSEHDVLDRYYQTAIDHSADIIVRITSDCPLIEPEIIDQLMTQFLELQPDLDYLSNSLPPRTYPRGLDVEVMRSQALKRAWDEDVDPSSREHVTPYIYNHPDLFQMQGWWYGEDLSNIRWTVDTNEDLKFVRKIYDHFANDLFSWLDVVSLLNDHPEWLAINQDIQQKEI